MRQVYARVSRRIVAQVGKVSAAYGAVTGSAAVGTERTHMLECGTLSSTTTSFKLQRRRTAPALVLAPAAVESTVAHPRHPLHLSVTRSPMWSTATTRSQRGYALGRSTLGFATRAADESAAAAAGKAGATAPDPSAHNTTGGNNNNDSRSAGGDGNASASPASSSSPSASVLLPDAYVLSFKGNPHEFQDRLRGANVLVFFYRAVCGPCAAIRSKLIHAVTDHLPKDAGDYLNGTGARKAAAASATATATATETSTTTAATHTHADAAALAAEGLREETAKAFAAPAEAQSAMTSEDKAVCELACQTLEDIARAFPHRMIFLTVDTNENAKLTALHDIRSLPTFVAYRDGCMMARVEGTDEAEVRRLVQTLTEFTHSEGEEEDGGEEERAEETVEAAAPGTHAPEAVSTPKGRA